MKCDRDKLRQVLNKWVAGIDWAVGKITPITVSSLTWMGGGGASLVTVPKGSP